MSIEISHFVGIHRRVLTRRALIHTISGFGGFNCAMAKADNESVNVVIQEL